MGKVLQIRVSAYTYRPEDMTDQWPGLCKLAWPEADWSTPSKLGVLELVERLHNESRLGDWSKELKALLEPGVERLAHIKLKLEQALGDWAPAEANRLSQSLEELLDELESKIPKDY